MRNLSLTSPVSMSNSNALLSSAPSLVLRAPRSKAKATKASPSTPVISSKEMALIQSSRNKALKALKRGYEWKYYSKAAFMEFKKRLNSETDLSKLGDIWDEILNKNTLGAKLGVLKVRIENKRNIKRMRRKGIWAFGGEWYVAKALVMMKDAVKFGIYDFKLYKENLKIALSPEGQILLGNVSLDFVLKHIHEIEFKMRLSKHPIYMDSEALREHIRNAISNWYYATPIIP